MLAGWDWARRPVGVVAVGSRTRPQLVGSLARRLAQIGRLDWLGELTRTGGGPPGAAYASNSVQRLAAVHDAFELAARAGGRGGRAGRPGAARGRHHGHGLDHDRGGPPAAQGRRARRAAARPRHRRVDQTDDKSGDKGR